VLQRQPLVGGIFHAGVVFLTRAESITAITLPGGRAATHTMKIATPYPLQALYVKDSSQKRIASTKSTDTANVLANTGPCKKNGANFTVKNPLLVINQTLAIAKFDANKTS
jgi:hypothetical protein